MIIVELRTMTGVPAGDPAQVVATITVDDDGAIRLDPPSHDQILGQAVNVRGSRVTAADDPHQWARGLRRHYRTPHLHAVTLHDDIG